MYRYANEKNAHSLYLRNQYVFGRKTTTEKSFNLYFKLSVLYIDSIVIDRFHENVSSGHFYRLFQSTYIFLLLK